MSRKHLWSRCPDGAFLLAYAGLGRIADVTVSEWLRELLRGEALTVHESLVRIREAATTDLGPLLQGRMKHMFSIAAFISGAPWFAQIRNLQRPEDPPSSEFLTISEPAGKGIFAFFGAHESLNAEDIGKLDRVFSRRPRRPEEFAALLAAINRRTAERDASVSPDCTVIYIPPSGDAPSESFHGPSASAGKNRLDPFSSQLILGVDTAALLLPVVERWTSANGQGHRSPEWEKEVERGFSKGIREAVTSRNRLRGRKLRVAWPRPRHSAPTTCHRIREILLCERIERDAAGRLHLGEFVPWAIDAEFKEGAITDHLERKHAGAALETLSLLVLVDGMAGVRRAKMRVGLEREGVRVAENFPTWEVRRPSEVDVHAFTQCCSARLIARSPPLSHRPFDGTRAGRQPTAIAGQDLAGSTFSM